MRLRTQCRVRLERFFISRSSGHSGRGIHHTLDDRTVITGSMDRIVLRDAALDIILLTNMESAIDAVDDPGNEGTSSAATPPCRSAGSSHPHAAAVRSSYRTAAQTFAPSVLRPERGSCAALRSAADGRRRSSTALPQAGRDCRPRELQPASRHDDDLARLPCPGSCHGCDARPAAARYRCDTSDRRTNRVVTAVAHARALTLSSLA